MKVKIKNFVIEADLANNFFKRMIGLSFSKKKNMLFTMPYEGIWPMWMFLVRYPIKIIFINKGKVVDIKSAVPITLNPKTWKIYKPKKLCKYVLETPFDFKIKIGDKITI
ncbi:MAG: DUF192 domain-containing protein [Candidatus Aenigmatarchaeota archaeon]